MPKAKKENTTMVKLRHDPLSTDMERPSGKLKEAKKKLTSKGHKKQVDNAEIDDYDEDIEEKYIDSRVLKEAKLQREEMDEYRVTLTEKPSKPAKAIDRDIVASDDEYEDYDEEEEEEDEENERLVRFEGEYVTTDDLDMTEEEEAIVQRFLTANRSESRTLADIIMEKIHEKEIETEAAPTSSALPPKVIEVYTAVGKLLKFYKSGKLPKALKMLPYLKNWEDVLWLTRPDEWSAGATYACTRIFASNLNAKMAQRFYNMILLEKCRDDIRSNMKLNYHLYMALKKALFKPAAFFKGIILPLAQSQSCTLREAIIFGSVLAKVSIQGNHSAAALLRLIEMPYSGSTSVFVKILLNKKHALPRRVIEALVNHFGSFISELRELPVLWHQALLVFAQRYKLEVDDSQKEILKELMRVHYHHSITPEIRRELFSNRT